MFQRHFQFLVCMQVTYEAMRPGASFPQKTKHILVSLLAVRQSFPVAKSFENISPWKNAD